MPRPLITAFTVLCAVLTAVLAAALFIRSSSDDEPLAVPGSAAAPITGLAYTVREGAFESIYVRDLAGTGQPRFLETFPVLFNLRIRGAAAPTGDALALLHIESGLGAQARLSVVDVATGENHDVEGGFDYLSTLAWRPDGRAVALTRPVVPNDPAQGAIVVEVDARSLTAVERHRFTTASRVHPVGYSADGRRLFVVVIDQAGSSLWALGERGPEQVAALSPGLTRDWSLSPDGSRLAFIDRLGAGSRSQAGRILVIATGEVVDANLPGDQVGVAWRPGAALPDFGGIEGTVRLSASAGGQYLAPLAWSPDGAYLVAVVYAPGESGGPASEQVEVLTASGRARLADEESAAFLGLVRNE